MMNFLNQILGEKKSVKRTVVSFVLCVIVSTVLLGAMLLVQSYIALRQYNEILQNIVLVEECQEQVEAIELSIKTVTETRTEKNYVEFRENLDVFRDQLRTVESGAREPSSVLAIRSIWQQIEILKTQPEQNRSWAGDYLILIRMNECCENIQYLLGRVQDLEVEYAAKIYPQLGKTAGYLIAITVVVLVLIVLLALAFLSDFHMRVYLPIRHLVSGVREISKGNFREPDVVIESDNEIRYLAESVNGMKRELSHLFTTREEKLKAERLLKETQFMALQSQVNPHFLFNALGAATSMALQEGADKTLDIMEAIAYMLRYSLQSVKTDVTLRDEIKMVEKYIFLQQQRFGSRISFAVQIDERIPDVPIPGMTVQPIVENAVVHGCEKMEVGGWLHVICRMDVEENCAVVTVENNGGVVSEEQLRAFCGGRSVPHSKKTTGIGMGNVRDRLQYFYDRDGLMDCSVIDGMINVITLRYPVDVRKV